MLVSARKFRIKSHCIHYYSFPLTWKISEIVKKLSNPFIHSLKVQRFQMPSSNTAEGLRVCVAWFLLTRAKHFSWMENGPVLTCHSCGEACFPILGDASLMSGFQALSQMKFLTSLESLINKSKKLGCLWFMLRSTGGNKFSRPIYWRRKWQPTPVFLPEESQGWRSLVGCHLWGHTELDTTEAT